MEGTNAATLSEQFITAWKQFQGIENSDEAAVSETYQVSTIPTYMHSKQCVNV